jgi:serine protease Do
VIAIGNAFGYEHTVTVGTVSALKRDVTLNKEISYKSLIQTQTPINPGNSGGPLFNKLGEVVGVNVAIRAGAQNIAFAIPVDTMIAKAGDMLSGKKRAGQRLGLTFGDKFERPAEDGPVRRSLIIERVDVGSTGADAGLKIGDVVEKIGDLAVNHSVDFERGLLDRPAKVRLKLNRSGETLEVDVATGNSAVTERATITPADAIWARTGLKLQPVGANYVTQVDKALRGGLWVAEVGTGTVAGKVGLQRGDIVLGFHLWESLTLDNVVFVLNHKDLATFSPLKIFYVREGKIRDVEVKLGE